MKFPKDTSGIERYIALDIHKEYPLVGGLRQRRFAGTNSKPRKLPENAAHTPIGLLHKFRVECIKHIVTI